MMSHNWLYDFMKTVCLVKIWFSSYWPKWSPPIRLQEFLNVNISKTIWGIIFISCIKLSMEALEALIHVIFAGFGHARPGMPNVLQNKKFPIYHRKFELSCLFVAYSYTSMEATELPCCFSRLWSSMPKVLLNNKSSISLERAEWFCWFFVCCYLHFVGYPLKVPKYAILGWHFQSSQSIKLSDVLNLKNPKSIWDMKMIFFFHWCYKKYAVLSHLAS